MAARRKKRTVKVIRTRQVTSVEEISLVDAMVQRAEEHAVMALDEGTVGYLPDRPIHLWRAKQFLELAQAFREFE